MDKSQKEHVVAELTERLRSSETLIVADYRGLTMPQVDALRTELLTHGAKFQVVLREGGGLGVVFPGQPFQALVPWKPRRFRLKEFSDVTVEFVVGPDGKVTALKQVDPSGEFVSPRQ